MGAKSMIWQINVNDKLYRVIATKPSRAVSKAIIRSFAEMHITRNTPISINIVSSVPYYQ